MLLAAGMTLSAALPQPRLAADATAVLGARLVPPLALSSLLLGLWGSAVPAVVLPLCTALLACCLPLDAAAVRYARAFKLNEPLAATISAASTAVCLPLALLLAGAVAALGLAPPSLAAGAAARVAAGGGAVAIPPIPAVVPFAAGLLLLAAAAAVASAQLYDHYRADNKVSRCRGLPAPSALAG
jgi:hypothetical protein